MSRHHLLDDDPHDRVLVARTRPTAGRVSRGGGARYDLVVLGGGPGGLVSAIGAAGLGARVALVERHLLGGDCLHTGCVPSKALLAAARAARAARRAGDLGVRVGDVRVDFPAVMARMRRLRADLSRHDAADRLRDAGVDVFAGTGRFTGDDTVEVSGRTLRFSRAIVATGARPLVPPIPGWEAIGGLTTDTLFGLTDLPGHLVVVGGGAVGAEMAQAFRAFGSRVTLVERAPRVLPREDPEAGRVLGEALRSDGVALVLGASVRRFAVDGGRPVVVAEREGAEVHLPADAVLMAVGRVPHVADLGLEAAGIAAGPAGVVVDDFLRTTNRRVYAVGDVATRFRYTHAADAMARLALRNALFFGRRRHRALGIPRCVYTGPEVAAVGIGAEEAQARGDVRVFRADARDLDRMVLDGQEDGFAKVFVDRRGRILGASLVGERAGELVNTLSVAMAEGVRLGALGEAVFAYPTASELLKRAGDAFNRARLTPGAARVLRAVLKLRW